MKVSAKPTGISKPVVIFCDCCVPVNQVEGLVSEFPPAHYVFVRKMFPEIVCRDDRKLFLRVHEFSQQFLSDSQIFFLTADKKDFLQNISDLEIKDVIRVIIMENVGNVSFETARIRTKAALQRIFNSCDR